MTDPMLRKLARQLVTVDKRVRDLETVPQLAHSSLDDQGMHVYDADGNLTVTVGKQPDGTWGAKPVAGPVPPRPVGLDAEGDAGAIRASWQGVFWAGAALPMDFEAVQVLVNGSVYAAIHDPEGGSVQVPALPGERLVSFRTLSQAGVVSEAVAFGTVTVEPRVSEQMQELGENLSELRDVTLPELADELDDAASDLQSKLDAANARIDDIVVDGGGAGNFTTYSINEPSGDGTGEGDQWFRVVNGEVLGQWHWDGHEWEPVSLTDAIISGIDLSKLVGNGGLSEVVANKMFTDIFSANKITAQELAAGSITTEKIAAEGITADVIQGGSFVGETFEGGSFEGGLFKTTGGLPGQVELADDGYITHFGGGEAYPGLRITPIDTSNMEYPAGIGPSTSGLTVYGGQSKSGGSSIVQANPDGSFLRTFRADGRTGGDMQTTSSASLMRTYHENGTSASAIQSSPEAALMRSYRTDGSMAGEAQIAGASCLMRTYRTDGSTAGEVRATGESCLMRTFTPGGGRGYIQVDGTYASQAVKDDNGAFLARIHADDREAYLHSAAGGARRYLSVDADGVWVKTTKGAPPGYFMHYNLEETAQDSGWNSFPVKSGITPARGLAWRNKNGVIYFRGTVQATWSAGWTDVVTGLPTEMRPADDTIALSPDSTDTSMIFRMTSDGTLRVWKQNAGSRTAWLSVLSYPLG